MTFWDVLNEHVGVIMTALVAVISAVAQIVQARTNARVQLSTVEPEITTHRCKVCGADIYSYFDQEDVAHPACPYLALDQSTACQYDAAWHPNPRMAQRAEAIQRAHGNKCYLAMWGRKVPDRN